MSTGDSVIQDIRKYFLVGAVLLLLVILFGFFVPFLSTVFMAAIITTAIYPSHKKVLKKFGNRKTLSSVITFALVLLLIIVPFALFTTAVVQQAASAISAISVQINEFRAYYSNVDISLIPQEILDSLKIPPAFLPENFASAAGDIVKTVSTFIIEQATNIVKQVSLFVLHVLVFLLALFYFLRDGEHLVHYTRALLPLPEEYRGQLFLKIYNTMRSIIFGFFGVAIVQGTLVGIGFALVGINDAFFWGAFAAIFSPIPFVGTTVVWLPAVASLAITQPIWLALFLLLWGVFVVGLSDNLIRPYLIGSGASLHPFLVFLVIIGGVFAFGFEGLIFGPLILSLTLSFLHIYRLEYATVLHPKKKENEVYKAIRI